MFQTLELHRSTGRSSTLLSKTSTDHTRSTTCGSQILSAYKNEQLRPTRASSTASLENTHHDYDSRSSNYSLLESPCEWSISPRLKCVEQGLLSPTISVAVSTSDSENQSVPATPTSLIIGAVFFATCFQADTSGSFSTGDPIARLAQSVERETLREFLRQISRFVPLSSLMVQGSFEGYVGRLVMVALHQVVAAVGSLDLIHYIVLVTP
ncbi:hypothetical protein QBC40DRAFT_292623 [Triangularia verruculosa]|uniref:Uncharacterized protein n=1 Tax=Triangularia verruculosa TaxID=2587418 RepID=A0AAN6XQ39_9PEZI|nr:hypothetical protein QBC40DRAFT_292623 [Triangularia verruculosa]